ncbi:Transcriptional regulator SKO1 [Candida viswanathii]|uniref:Transcriptional regulator SKO1 n=1 Tax=Candida viswanathii TaxID=5486 RepID=A0A367XRZ1_9ASCO|nr:Transcriptional regulator SKO1 [Candida viswanathii]
MSSDHKSKFDLEPNPFERSFATKESSNLSLNELANNNNNNNDTNSDINSIGSNSAISSSTKTNGNSNNKHNLHIPNISNVNQHQQQPDEPGNGKLPGITPPLFTPGGRRLPPIGLSPGGSTAKQYTSGLSNGSLTTTNNNPDSNLWPSFIGSQNPQAPQLQLQQNFSQLLSSIRKTGLTPNESNIRLGLTPGGLGSFGFSNHLVPGLSTPSALLNGPITPGLSSLLGIPANSSMSNNNSNLPVPQQQQQAPPPPQQQQQQQQQPMLAPHQIPQHHQQQQQHQPPAPPPQQHLQQQGHEIAHIHNPGPGNQGPPVVVSVPPQIAQQLPQPHQQHPQHQQGGIHTIPENPVASFPMPAENQHVSGPAVTTSNTGQGSASASPPTATRKRKNSVKLGDEPVGAAKKAKATKTKKKEPKTKLKTEPNTEPAAESQSEDASRQADSEQTEDKQEKEETKPTKGKGKKKGNNDEEKRKNFLERNRVAASKCRQRKKQLIQKMEDELAFYLTGYRELSAQVAQLRGQLMTLKNVIAGHKDCSMFIQYLGGFNALNELVQQADFATQVTEGAHTNMTSMPSTIPTTLNNVPPSSTGGNTATTTAPGSTGDDSQADNPPSAPTTTMAPPLPIADHTSSHSNTRNVTPDVGFDQQHSRSGSALGNGAHIASHHSLTDLPAAALNGNNGVFGGNHRVVGGDNTGGRDLRAISSMSNLAAMNTNNGTSNTTTITPF